MVVIMTGKNYGLQIEKLWALAKFKPNPAQKDAILYPDGPLFITAGPGSGKTRVLLWRTVNLMAFHGVKPEEIFLSTFYREGGITAQAGIAGAFGLCDQYQRAAL
jgi:DNA helicase-2/ATP-dependent DNA helicase PcrA